MNINHFAYLHLAAINSINDHPIQMIANLIIYFSTYKFLRSFFFLFVD